MNAPQNLIRPDLIDRMMDLYCDWRTECAGVQVAYERFSSAGQSDRAMAFAAYTAALDREESAGEAYAAHIRLIMSRGAADGGTVARRRGAHCP